MVSAKKFNRKRIPIIIISVILIFCTVSLAATKIIYDAIFQRYDEPAQIPTALDAMVENREICSFPSGENQLTGYYYGTTDPARANGLIVLVPGFHAGGDDYLWQIRELRDYGWGIFTFDASGTRQSEGESQVGFSQLIPDLEAALKYVERNDRFGYNEIVLVGHSRGAYAACCVLAQPWDVAAVVAISGVNSAMESIMQMSKQAVGPISYGNYGFLWLYQAALFGADTLQLQAADVISQRDIPVLVIHGTQDRQIPMEESSIISHQEQITSGKVEYLLCDGDHTDLLYGDDGTANDVLMAKIHNFLIRGVEK